MIRGLLLAALVVVLVGALPGPASAQTLLLGAAGLGRPVRPLDARARAMGGAAVALHRDNLSAVNPASLSWLGGSGIWGTFMPESRSVKGPGISGDVRTSEFPLGRIGLPVSEGWAVAIGFGGFLNQDWTAQFEDTLNLSSGDLPYQETRQSSGGISQFRADVARALSDRWSVGVAAILYSGEVRSSVERAFPASSEFTGYTSGSAVKYSGWGGAVGVQYRPIEEMILGADASWSPHLTARNDSTGQRRRFDMPLSLDVGGSWEMTPGFVLATSAGWSGWSVIPERQVRGGVNDAWYAGFGTELRALSNLSTAIYLRLGAHLERLPFELRGNALSERTFSFGLGGDFGNGQGRGDIAVELGKRGSISDNGLEESFTRLTFSVAVFSH